LTEHFKGAFTPSFAFCVFLLWGVAPYPTSFSLKKKKQKEFYSLCKGNMRSGAKQLPEETRKKNFTLYMQGKQMMKHKITPEKQSKLIIQ